MSRVLTGFGFCFVQNWFGVGGGTETEWGAGPFQKPRASSGLWASSQPFLGLGASFLASGPLPSLFWAWGGLFWAWPVLGLLWACEPLASLLWDLGILAFSGPRGASSGLF